MNTRSEIETVKEKPILFSAQMVRAILDGKKTQTRRLVKMEPFDSFDGARPTFDCHDLCDGDYGFFSEMHSYRCFRPGTRLWVKETFLNNALEGYEPVYLYRADSHEKPADRKWKPSVFMPRKASRITLEVTQVRVQRLWEISEEDAQAEGIDMKGFRSGFEGIDGYEHRIEFRGLWESINGKGSWDKNPWVWCITFKRIV